jgi:putative FmdB family regulatory protein
VPAYDYQCDACGRTFEIRQRISADPLTTDPECGGPVHRLLSATPFILRGGGWYVTDYPSEGRKKGVEAEKKASAAPAEVSAASAASTSSAASPSSSSSTSAPSSGTSAPAPSSPASSSSA